METTFNREHWVIIKVKQKHTAVIESLKWEGLPFFVRVKWNWYFKYRAALLQVKYPKCDVELSWGHNPASEQLLEKMRKVQITTAKAQVTKWENSIAKAKEAWNELFPIEEDNSYQRAVAKLEVKKKELQFLLNQS